MSTKLLLRHGESSIAKQGRFHHSEHADDIHAAVAVAQVGSLRRTCHEALRQSH